MSCTSMLKDNAPTSDGDTRSPLENIFGPNIAYRDIHLRIMGQLTQEDFNAMRRTSSTLNSSLTMLDDQGRPLYPQSALRDTCDSGSESFWASCIPGSIFSSAYEPNRLISLKRCTRQPNEEGFCDPPVSGHEKEGGLVVCATCYHTGKYYVPFGDYENIISALREMTEEAQWALCLHCEFTKQRQYPDGAQFCDCFDATNRRVLCYDCLEQRVLYFFQIFKWGMSRRHHIWRDDLTNEINFGRENPTLRRVCLECAAGPSLPERTGGQTRICMFCRKCTIIAAPQCERFTDYLCRDWRLAARRVPASTLQPPRLPASFRRLARQWGQTGLHQSASWDPAEVRLQAMVHRVMTQNPEAVLKYSILSRRRARRSLT